MKIIRQFKSFTLAEILITLGIIGIVANMTVPAIIFNIQRQGFASTLKKEYSTFNQALLLMSTDMGCTGDLVCTSLFATGKTPQDIGDAIVPYLKVAKNCQMNADQGCFSNSYASFYDGSGTRIGPPNGWDSATTRYKFITIDGSAIVINNYASGCTGNYGSGIMSQVCGIIYMDVNGLKGPNNNGRDIFVFYITSNGLLYPYGGKFHNLSGTSYYWKDQGACQPATASTISGGFCSGRVMDEGWQINY